MKNKINVTKSNDKIHFYLVSGKVHLYLFSQNFSKGVYNFFMKGRSEAEILGFKKWRDNPRLDKTVTKLPMYIRFALKECA